MLGSQSRPLALVRRAPGQLLPPWGTVSTQPPCFPLLRLPFPRFPTRCVVCAEEGREDTGLPSLSAQGQTPSASLRALCSERPRQPRTQDHHGSWNSPQRGQRVTPRGTRWSKRQRSCRVLPRGWTGRARRGRFAELVCQEPALKDSVARMWARRAPGRQSSRGTPCFVLSLTPTHSALLIALFVLLNQYLLLLLKNIQIRQNKAI